MNARHPPHSLTPAVLPRARQLSAQERYFRLRESVAIMQWDILVQRCGKGHIRTEDDIDDVDFAQDVLRQLEITAAESNHLVYTALLALDVVEPESTPPPIPPSFAGLELGPPEIFKLPTKQ